MKPNLEDDPEPVSHSLLLKVGLAVKRVVDATLAAALLVLLSPVLVGIALAVGLNLGSPILYRQERPGRDAQPFTVRKFRTMTEALGPSRVPLPDALRLTRFGTAIRSAGLDELPQLLNIVAGDMSFIGPRPLLIRYLPYFTTEERVRFRMRPGITGWAQVNGRNNVAWNSRLAQDVWYVEHWSLLLDMRIAVKTVGAILTRRGFEADPESKMANLDDERRLADQR